MLRLGPASTEWSYLFIPRVLPDGREISQAVDTLLGGEDSG